MKSSAAGRFLESFRNRAGREGVPPVSLYCEPSKRRQGEQRDSTKQPKQRDSQSLATAIAGVRQARMAEGIFLVWAWRRCGRIDACGLLGSCIPRISVFQVHTDCNALRQPKTVPTLPNHSGSDIFSCTRLSYSRNSQSGAAILGGGCYKWFGSFAVHVYILVLRIAFLLSAVPALLVF